MLATCHLYPFFPNFNLYRLKSEFAFLFHPCDTQYCCCTVGFYLAGIGIALGEWFVVTSLLQAIFGRMRSRWIVAALCLRIMLRPMVITRPLGPDEVIGALLALFLWLILPETARWRVSFFMLAAVVFVRELGPFHFSAVPTGFSWIPFADVFAAQRQGETIFLFQKVFDYGSLIWLLCAARRSQVQAGLLIASYITVLEAIQMYSQGHRPTTTDPILILLITIGLRFANSDGSHRMAGQHPAAVQ